MKAPKRAAALLALLLIPVAAAAATQPLARTRPAPRVVTPDPQLAADPAAVRPGAAVTLHGSGFPRNVHVALMAGPPHGDRARIGGARTGRRGRFTATIHVRPGSSAGRLVAVACHDACRIQARVSFRILAP